MAPVWVWVPGEDVLLDWTDVFPGSVVFLALGLNVITVLDHCSVNDGARDV